jgi:hypothetical protein
MANTLNNAIVVPAGTPGWVTEALIELTIRVWQPYYAEPLTIDDALGIMQAAGRLLQVLGSEDQRCEAICRVSSGQ